MTCKCKNKSKCTCGANVKKKTPMKQVADLKNIYTGPREKDPGVLKAKKDKAVRDKAISDAKLKADKLKKKPR
jgi:hypothetical protein